MRLQKHSSYNIYRERERIKKINYLMGSTKLSAQCTRLTVPSRYRSNC